MKIFNILDYGAKVCDRNQRDAIQAALDDCFLQGGGRVVIPSGVFLTGGLRLRSNTELYLESGAILKGSLDPEDYLAFWEDQIEPVVAEPIGDTPKTRPSSVATSRWCNALIRALDAENIAVVGEIGSFFDGSNVFDEMGEEHYRGPHGMSFWRCRGIRLEGYSFLNSSNWCHAIFQSRDITVREIKVYGGHDGVDVRTCDNVLLENCTFLVGDDAVAGFDNHDVTVQNCILDSACHALRFGGNNVRVANCRSHEAPLPFGFRGKMEEEAKRANRLTGANDRHEMTAPFSYYCDYRADLRKPAEQIVIENCHFAEAKELIRLEFDGLHRWCCNRSLRSLSFRDCSIRGLTRTGMLWGDEKEKVTVSFCNVTVQGKKERENDVLFVAANFDKIIFENVCFEGYEAPVVYVADEGEVVVKNCNKPLRIVRATREECLRLHPYGIHPDDKKRIGLV